MCPGVYGIHARFKRTDFNRAGVFLIMAFSIQTGGSFPALHFSAGRLSHAYILSGASAAARHSAGTALAAAMVCSSSGVRPCGSCRHCQKAQAGIHPDILSVRRDSDRKEIYIAQIRAILADAPIMPNEAEKKVYVIEEADTMNAAAQNAMLKLLEEPPAHAAFLLLAENPGTLLETVRSRCVEINLTEGPGAAPELDEEAESLARDLVAHVISGDRLELVSFLFSLEQLDRLKLAALADAAMRLAVGQLGRGQNNAEDHRRLSNLVHTLQHVGDYLNYNVSTGHITGLLLAELV